MNIVPMHRVTLCGVARDKAAVLDGLQALGVMHIIPLSEPGPLAPDDPATRRRAETAFRYIMDAPERLRPYRDRGAFDPEAVIAGIMANRHRLRELSDRRDELEALIDGLEPWGDFTLPAADAIGGERLWLYALPLKDRAALGKLTLPWEVVGRTPTELLVVVISPEEPSIDLLPVRRTETEAEPLSALREALAVGHGTFLPRGVSAPGLDPAAKWSFASTVRIGDRVRGGDTVGTVPEGPITQGHGSL